MRQGSRYRSGIAACLLVIACGGPTPNFYKPYMGNETYANFGQDSTQNGIKPSDPVTAERFCISLSNQAMKRSTVQMVFGYAASFAALSLVTVGAVWAATDTNPADKQRRRAVLAFPAAAVPLVPVATFLFNRARNNARLASDTVSVVQQPRAGEACNEALFTWHRARDTDLSIFAASMDKSQQPYSTQVLSSDQLLDAIRSAVNGLSAKVSLADAGGFSPMAREDLTVASLKAARGLDELKDKAKLLREDLAEDLKSSIEVVEQRLHQAQASLGVAIPSVDGGEPINPSPEDAGVLGDTGSSIGAPSGASGADVERGQGRSAVVETLAGDLASSITAIEERLHQSQAPSGVAVSTVDSGGSRNLVMADDAAIVDAGPPSDALPSTTTEGEAGAGLGEEGFTDTGAPARSQ